MNKYRKNKKKKKSPQFVKKNMTTEGGISDTGHKWQTKNVTCILRFKYNQKEIKKQIPFHF